MIKFSIPKKNSVFQFINQQEQRPIILFLIKWVFICSVVGLLVGSASALFLVSLNWVTGWREANIWIIALLPIGGLIVGVSYHYLGKRTERGNNLLIENIHTPDHIIPFKMAPLVLFGTIVTHIFGGSAGREGTAVQMGGAIADQFTTLFKLGPNDRKLLIITGISAGFASVFGTPLAGAVFGLEVFLIGRMRYDAILPSMLAAVVADYATKDFWGVGHTHYHIDYVPELSPVNIVLALFTGICFGLTGRLFAKTTHTASKWFKTNIAHPIARPFIGGIVLAIAFYGVYHFMHTTKYMGLGIPTIEEAFMHPLPSYDFIMKLLFTAFTLGCGFKGGEVTPLFFIGAALGSTLSLFVPLPTPLLAGMGFVAVFAGAANTPIACTIMAMELFGSSCGAYVGIASIAAYLFSGHTGIYSSQVIGSAKHTDYKQEEGQKLSSISEYRKTGKNGAHNSL